MTIASHVGPVSARVGRNVLQRREAAGLTVTDLSQECERLTGVSLSELDIRSLEQGDRPVDVGELVALALGLDASVPQLLTAPAAADSTGDVATVPVSGSKQVPLEQYVASIGAAGPAVAGDDSADRQGPRHARSLLKDAGHTTEQLRDRFGPESALGDRSGEPAP